MKNKKLVIILGVILLLMVIGVSYAWLTTTILGKKEYILKAGDLDLVLDETSNGLMIEDDIPVEDFIGLRGDGAIFSVRNNSNHNICYQIYLDDTDLLEGQVRVDDRFVKYSLDKDSVVGEAKVLSSGRLIDETEIKAGSSINYKLRLWFNSEIDGEIAGQLFKGRLRIEAMQCGNSLPIMKSYANNIIPTEDYHAEEYRTKIISVVTKNDTNIPTSAISVTGGKGNYFDVSEAEDNSVVAYLEETDGFYRLTLGGNNGISTNSMAMLFSGFSNLISVDLSNFDTSKAKEMSYLFSECSSLQSIDVSMFDTGYCTNMAAMFRNCSNLQRIDLSSFDTYSLQLVNQMFRGCTILKSINFGQFDTSNVTYFHEMFYECRELTVLDLFNFDTSKFVYMNKMFFGCSKLTSILVSSKWTTGNKDIYMMFDGCGVDHVTLV